MQWHLSILLTACVAVSSQAGCSIAGYSAAELQRAANSLAPYPNTAELELMTPAFSVLAKENRRISGLVFLCNWQISLVDQALLWDSDKSSNPCLLVCHYPNHLISLGHSSLLIFDLFRLYAPRVRDTLSNHNTQSYSVSLSLLAASLQKTSLFSKGSCLNYIHSLLEEIHIASTTLDLESC